jgi:hypothetical protein
MYVWERLHVQGRRNLGRARRRRNFTDLYPLFKKKKLQGKFLDFLTIWWKATFWLVENQFFLLLEI